jgi:hypothetical protein
MCLTVLKWIYNNLHISVTIPVIHRKCSLINELSSETIVVFVCKCVCYSVPPAMLEQGPLKSKDCSLFYQTQD